MSTPIQFSCWVWHRTCCFFRFPCGRWLGKMVDDGSTERLLVAQLLPQHSDTYGRSNCFLSPGGFYYIFFACASLQKKIMQKNKKIMVVSFHDPIIFPNWKYVCYDGFRFRFSCCFFTSEQSAVSKFPQEVPRFRYLSQIMLHG